MYVFDCRNKYTTLELSVDHTCLFFDVAIKKNPDVDYTCVGIFEIQCKHFDKHCTACGKISNFVLKAQSS